VGARRTQVTRTDEEQADLIRSVHRVVYGRELHAVGVSTVAELPTIERPLATVWEFRGRP